MIHESCVIHCSLVKHPDHHGLVLTIAGDVVDYILLAPWHSTAAPWLPTLCCECIIK